MNKEEIITIITLLMFTAFVHAVRADAQEAVAPSAYRLIGTIEGKDIAGAVLIDSAGSQTFFRLHETAPDGSQIVAVESDSVLLKRPDGTRYALYINHDMAAASLSSSSGSYRGPAAAAAPGPAAFRPTPPDTQRFAQRPGGLGAVDRAREEARERCHNKPGRSAVDGGAGADRQNYAATSPNGSAAGVGANQPRRGGPRPPGRKQPPGASSPQ